MRALENDWYIVSTTWQPYETLCTVFGQICGVVLIFLSWNVMDSERKGTRAVCVTVYDSFKTEQEVKLQNDTIYVKITKFK